MVPNSLHVGRGSGYIGAAFIAWKKRGEPMGMVRSWCLCAVLFCLSACVNPYADSYRSAGVDPSILAMPPAAPSLITHGNGWEPEQVSDEADHMYEQGFTPVGWSSFTSTLADHDLALAQGAEVGAACVSVYQKFNRTEHGVTTRQEPHKTIVMSEGRDGRHKYKDKTTITTYTTVYEPYTTDYYEQLAVYYAPLAPKGVGLNVRTADAGEKKAAGVARAVVVVAVRKGSPAYRADVAAGDVLLTADGHGLDDAGDVDMAFAAANGAPVRLVWLRDKKKMEKDIAVPEMW